MPLQIWSFCESRYLKRLVNCLAIGTKLHGTEKFTRAAYSSWIHSPEASSRLTCKDLIWLWCCVFLTLETLTHKLYEQEKNHLKNIRIETERSKYTRSYLEFLMLKLNPFRNLRSFSSRSYAFMSRSFIPTRKREQHARVSHRALSGNQMFKYFSV